MSVAFVIWTKSETPLDVTKILFKLAGFLVKQKLGQYLSKHFCFALISWELKNKETSLIVIIVEYGLRWIFRECRDRLLSPPPPLFDPPRGSATIFFRNLYLRLTCASLYSPDTTGNKRCSGCNKRGLRITNSSPRTFIMVTDVSAVSQNNQSQRSIRLPHVRMKDPRPPLVFGTRVWNFAGPFKNTHTHIESPRLFT